jgi:hypothetical protein
MPLRLEALVHRERLENDLHVGLQRKGKGKAEPSQASGWRQEDGAVVRESTHPGAHVRREARLLPGQHHDAAAVHGTSIGADRVLIRERVEQSHADALEAAEHPWAAVRCWRP